MPFVRKGGFVLPKEPIARVFLLDTVYRLDKLYSYRLPDSLRESVFTGSVVSVPFGAANHKKTAVVYAIDEQGDASDLPVGKLKAVCEHSDASLTLSPEQLRLCTFLKEHTFCTFGEAFRAMIPLSAYSHVKYLYSADTDRMEENKETIARLSREQAALYARLCRQGDAPFASLKSEFGEKTGRLLSALKDKGLVTLREKTKSSGRVKTSRCYSLSVSREEAQKAIDSLRGESRKKLLRLLIERGELSDIRIKEEKIGKAPIDFLIEQGLIVCRTDTLYRDPAAAFEQQAQASADTLNGEQQQALDRLSALAASGEGKGALLFGVTGSGKTHVVTALIDRVLASGRQAIYLVPEISLTPQTVSIFQKRYGRKIALYHSALSDGERFDAWRRMKNGDACVCVGTRSAIFAPFDNLGLIVLDEEQEHTYKSDSAPRYHARDVARFRAASHRALMLLCSATPSLESAYRAKSGSYELVRLNSRFNGSDLPQTRFADLRTDSERGSGRAIGSELQAAIAETLKKGEQAILFVNRRGYHNFVSCPFCGQTLVCPHCSVSMTFHSTGRADAEARVKSGYLSCHYCGHRELVPDKCPSCGKGPLNFLGFGTQKAEEELKALFPEATVMRLDADTVGSKHAYEEKLTAFRNGKAQILLGTQMVVKGHDFPNVTLVGVLLADSSLYISDFRANEHTFSLLTQVTGRAGRADKKGLSLIQTYCPEHTTLALAQAQDFPAFYADEIKLRKNYLFPPFCDIVLLEIASSDETALLQASVALSARLVEKVKTEFADVKLQLFGPFEAPLYKLKGSFRMRLVLKCRFNARMRALLAQIKGGEPLSKKANISLSIDVNPHTL